MPSHNASPAIISTLLAFAVVSPASAAGEIVITQAKAYAGNVTPGDPPGFPVVITQPGAYVLESNLTVPPGNYGFAINANNVDLDMNGFTLTGNGAATYGIYSGFGESRIHDGVINRFIYSGIYLRNNAWTIDNMEVVRNGGAGIDATGARYIKVQDSLVAANAGSGTILGEDASALSSVISNNGLVGINCGKHCIVDSSTISKNPKGGIYIGSGLINGNTIGENGFFGGANDTTFYGVFSNTSSAGMSNNMLVSNNGGVTNSGDVPAQTFGVRQIGANGCVGARPCFQVP